MTFCEIEGEMFTVSGDFGGGMNCQRMFLPLDRLFSKLVRGLRSDDYLIDLDRFEFWLYFGGTIWDHEGLSGPGRLATGRNPPRVIIDLRFARSDYEGKSQEEVRQQMASALEICFQLMLARALKKKAVKDEARLLSDFANVMSKFRTEPIPPFVPLGTPQYL